MDARLKEFAKSLPGSPRDFGYFGDKPDFDRWRYLPIVGNSRDANTLERSNWEVVTEDITEKYPDGFKIEYSSHWAIGWVESVRVDTENEEALRLALDWKERLDDYPLADEEHHSNLELQEHLAGWDSWAKSDLISEMEDDEELSILTNAEDGVADDFASERAEEFVKQAYLDAVCMGEGFEGIVEQVRAGLEDYLLELKEEERREFEKYQIPLPLEV